MSKKRTSAQRAREQARRLERLATDPEYRERKREQARRSAAKQRAASPGKHAAMMRQIRARGADGQGKVYFLRAGQAIKIGFTTRTLEARVAELQPGNPERLEVLGWRPGTITDETKIHDQFRELWLLGEWFRLTPELLAFCTTTASSAATFPSESSQLS